MIRFQRTSEFDCGDTFKGEKSPYWIYLENQHRHDGLDGDVPEPILANPDSLSEADGFYASKLSQKEIDRLDSIKEGWVKLTKEEKKTVYLCGVEGMSMARCAVALGVSKSTVQSALTRARNKILRLHTVRNGVDSL